MLAQRESASATCAITLLDVVALRAAVVVVVNPTNERRVEGIDPCHDGSNPKCRHAHLSQSERESRSDWNRLRISVIAGSIVISLGLGPPRRFVRDVPEVLAFLGSSNPPLPRICL